MENHKGRFEHSRDIRSGTQQWIIRCAQGHSAGSGARPECLPIAGDSEYLANGTSLEAARIIAQDGLSRRNRLHIHFYECDRNGHVLGGETVRAGSEVVILATAQQCVEDGIVFYKSANNVILSEGFRGGNWASILPLRPTPRSKPTTQS